jgi:hypothetical protein
MEKTQKINVKTFLCVIGKIRNEMSWIIKSEKLGKNV